VQPGDILLDKYRVEELLGVGGMGKVVRASHVVLQQQFAIKVLLPHMTDSAETVSRFLREAQSTSALKSEHIARVIDSGRLPDGAPFMVMEYLQGHDLNQILRHHGPQHTQVVCDLMLQACEGIAEAHAMGIVHRDIKPSNFFITTRPDGTMLLKILDFGISKTPVGVTELTGASTVIGTPTYMAPEQMKSGKDADARSDIWSMGIVMYQLIAGRPPFVGESYAELVLKVGSEIPPPIAAQLPPGLEQVIMTCLEKNPAQRQQTVADLARMLAPYASDPTLGMQSAQRTARILANANRGSARGMDALPITSNGGLAAPLASPRASKVAWPPTGNSSLSHGRGQVTHTHHVRGRGGSSWRIGRLVATFVVLGLLVTAGVFGAKRLMSSSGDDDRDSGDDPTHVHVAAPPSADPPKPEGAPTTVVAPDPVATNADPKAAAPPADPKADEPKAPKEIVLQSEPTYAADPSKPAPEPEVAAKTEPPKPIAKPVDATKPTGKPGESKPITKPTIVKADPKKPVKKKRPKNEDLFNSRH